jgi:general secretion pathway protein D
MVFLMWERAMQRSNPVPRLSLLRGCCAVLAGLTVATLSGCATNPDAALEPAKTLLAEGRLQEGHALLSERATQYPSDAPTRLWLSRARERYSASVAAQAESQLRQGQWSAAEASYRELGQIPGFEAARRDGLERVAAARERSQPEGRSPTPQSGTEPQGALRLDRNLSLGPLQAPPAHHPSQQAMQRRLSLQFRDAPVRSLFDVIGKTAQVAIVFDRDVSPDLKASVSLRDVTVQAAIEKVALTAGLSHRLLDDGTVLIYPDQPRKQADYQGLSVRSFYLTNVDARFMASSLKTLLKSRDVVVDTKLNMLVVRDTPEALRLTEQLVQMHDVPEPEVMLEVEVIEVKRSLLDQLGVQWPGQVSLSPLPALLQTSGLPFDRTLPVTLRDILGLSPGKVEAGIGPVTLNARREEGDVNILATPRLRAKSREKARIMIGERVPNITSTSTATGFVAESVNYVDVGLKLEVEPQVFAGGEVVIKLGLEVSSIIDQTQTRSGSSAYRISTRNANTVLRLKDGENQLLAGLIQDEDQRNSAKLPGLGELPLVGRLFGAKRDSKSKTEIILSITPRLIRPLLKPGLMQSSFELGTVSGIRGRSDEGSVEQTSPEPAELAPADASGSGSKGERGNAPAAPNSGNSIR